jgi:N-hydroxyarylamine O-acetyltransferase
MHSDNFNISTYFNRINYTGPAGANTATLHALMRHQLFSVPFENLDVQAGKVVSLAPDDIADKVLTQGRGGYCYEVNGLFAMALAALGILTASWRRARCSTPRGGRKPTWRSSLR